MDAITKELRWRYETDGSIVASPAVADGRVYTGSTDGYVYALDAASGARGWRFRTGGEVRSSPRRRTDGVVSVISRDGYVYGLDADNGEQLWRYQTGFFVETSPALVGGVVYVGSDDGYLYALDCRQWGSAVALFDAMGKRGALRMVIGGGARVRGVGRRLRVRAGCPERRSALAR